MKKYKYGNWVSAVFYFNVTSKQNSACILHAGELMGGMLPICMSKPVKAQHELHFNENLHAFSSPFNFHYSDTTPPFHTINTTLVLLSEKKNSFNSVPMTRLLGHCFGDLRIWPVTGIACVCFTVCKVFEVIVH